MIYVNMIHTILGALQSLTIPKILKKIWIEKIGEAVNLLKNVRSRYFSGLDIQQHWYPAGKCGGVKEERVHHADIGSGWTGNG